MKQLLFGVTLLLIPSFVLADQASPPPASTTTSGCDSLRFTQAAYDSIGGVMREAEVSGLLGCPPTASQDTTDALDAKLRISYWNSSIGSITVTFRNDVYYRKSVGGRLSGAPGPAIFDSTKNILSVPLTLVGQDYYMNLVLALPAGGVWQIVSVSDQSGNPLSIPAAASTAGGLVTSGALSGYAGVLPGTFLRLPDGTVWRGGQDCNIPAPTTQTSTSQTTPTTAAAPQTAYIYLIGSKYIFSTDSQALTCEITKVTP